MEVKPQPQRHGGREDKKKKGKRASKRPHRNTLWQINYSIWEERERGQITGSERLILICDWWGDRERRGERRIYEQLNPERDKLHRPQMVESPSTFFICDKIFRIIASKATSTNKTIFYRPRVYFSISQCQHIQLNPYWGCDYPEGNTNQFPFFP